MIHPKRRRKEKSKRYIAEPPLTQGVYTFTPSSFVLGWRPSLAVAASPGPSTPRLRPVHLAFGHARAHGYDAAILDFDVSTPPLQRKGHLPQPVSAVFHGLGSRLERRTGWQKASSAISAALAGGFENGRQLCLPCSGCEGVGTALAFLLLHETDLLILACV
ncbi:hypothetical protein HYQ46_005365 [Verticillium longisporum]|nr:hypothetical protein HYQ46_005365 [Verticillium longisporum]